MNKTNLTRLAVGLTALCGLSANVNAALTITETISKCPLVVVNKVNVHSNCSKPVEVEPLPKHGSQIAAIDAHKIYQADQIYKYERLVLVHNYSPRTNHQILLPLDIADTKVKRVKDVGYQTNFDLSGNKDKLSIYLSQNKHALHLVGLYKQRLLGWHEGKPPYGVTIQNAVDEEALFKFLDIELVSNQTTPAMLTYLEKRLGSKEIDVVRNWVDTNADQQITSTVIEILSDSIAKAKTHTYPYNP